MRGLCPCPWTAVRISAALFLGACRLAVGADAAAAAPPFRRAVEEVQKAAHAHPDRSAAYFESLERGFRELQGRYPNEGEVYAELLFVADHAPGERATALLNQILAWPAPKAVQDKTRGVLLKQSSLGQPFDRQLPALNGTALHLSEFKGKVVLIDFWASWCPPCREKLPEIKTLYRESQSKGFEIVGISFDDDLGKLRRFLETEGIAWPQVADGKGWDGPRAAEFGITSLPSMWLIDRQGRLRDVDARENLQVSVRRLLDEAPL